MANVPERRCARNYGTLFCMLLFVTATAVAAEPTRSPAASAGPRNAEADAATYERCLKFAKQNPGAAQSLAQTWHERGGAHPADHCAAVALFGLKRYKEAATRLEALAQALTAGPTGIRCGLMRLRVKRWACNRMIPNCSSIERKQRRRLDIMTRQSPISTMS